MDRNNFELDDFKEGARQRYGDATFTIANALANLPGWALPDSVRRAGRKELRTGGVHAAPALGTWLRRRVKESDSGIVKVTPGEYRIAQ